MVKVIKLNVTLSLILLLSIPAYAVTPTIEKSGASQTTVLATTAAAVVAKEGMKAVADKVMSKMYNAVVPSWQYVKGKAGVGLSWAGKGFSAIAHTGQIALSYVTPTAKASLAFASRHSTTVKILGGTLAAASLGIAVWKTYKYWHHKHATQTHKEPAVPAAPVAQPAIQGTLPAAPVAAPVVPAATPQAPVAAQAVNPTDANHAIALLRASKAAAEADIATWIRIRDAGKAYAALKKRTDIDEKALLQAMDTFIILNSSFRNTMATTAIPTEQAALRDAFDHTCSHISDLIAGYEDNCLDDHKAEFDARIGELQAIIAGLDEAMAIKMSMQQTETVAQAQQEANQAAIIVAPEAVVTPTVTTPAVAQPAAVEAQQPQVIQPAAAHRSIFGAPRRAITGLWKWLRGNNATPTQTLQAEQPAATTPTV